MMYGIPTYFIMKTVLYRTFYSQDWYKQKPTSVILQVMKLRGSYGWGIMKYFLYPEIETYPNLSMFLNSYKIPRRANT